MLNKQSLLILIFIILVHGLILTKLIYFPYPEIFIYPYLTNNGLKPYQQVLDQHFPGLLFLPINFNNLGLTSPDIARGWSIGIIVLNQILLFIIGKKILGSYFRALLISFLYLIWQPFLEGWVLWIDNFLPLLLLPAFYAFTNNKFFTAGLLIGGGIVCKQVLIPLAIFTALYILLREKNVKLTVIFLIGVAIPIVFMLIYLAFIGVLKDFWYWTVVFNLTTYAQYGRGTGPTVAHFTRVLFIFGSAFFALSLYKFKTKETQLLIIFLVGTLLGLSTRFDFVHFQPALPFAVLATVYGLGKLKGLGRLGAIGLYSLVLIWWAIIFYKGHVGDRIISFDSSTMQLAAKIRSYSSPKEKIFIFGTAPQLYQMTNTLPAGNIFVFQFPWFLKVSENRILEGIKKDNPKIIVSQRNALVEGQKISDFAKDIDLYITSNYQKVDSVKETEILRLKVR